MNPHSGSDITLLAGISKEAGSIEEGGWHGRTVNGQEMAEGSDGSGNELGMELGGREK